MHNKRESLYQNSGALWHFDLKVESFINVSVPLKELNEAICISAYGYFSNLDYNLISLSKINIVS